MYTKIINPNHLEYEEMEKKVTRVKVLIFNDDNQILLCNVEGIYNFIGGHVENNETIEMALVREIKEETGISLNKDKYEPFLKIEKWNKNHFNTGKKCISEIYYYSINTKTKPDEAKMNLDDFEIRRNFFLQYMKTDEFYNYLKKEKQNSPLYEEMYYVLKFQKKNYKGENNGKRMQKKI